MLLTVPSVLLEPHTQQSAGRPADPHSQQSVCHYNINKGQQRCVRCLGEMIFLNLVCFPTAEFCKHKADVDSQQAAEKAAKEAAKEARKQVG